MPQHQLQPLPEFDRASGKNPFVWILRIAAELRAKRTVDADRLWLARENERRAREKAQA